MIRRGKATTIIKRLRERGGRVGVVMGGEREREGGGGGQTDRDSQTDREWGMERGGGGGDIGGGKGSKRRKHKHARKQNGESRPVDNNTSLTHR